MPAKKRRGKETPVRRRAEKAGVSIPASPPVGPARPRSSPCATPGEADFIAMLAAMGYFD
ncbi:MAG TPA: hypothetical protein PK696_05640 [bacterium]|jgi:hypothetical protein|nr:hypothetical protein [Chlamydiota bacterium]HOE27159.1 hypothetical protein [bacterium]HQM51747.1 hypothetical protein [bacterium]